MLSSVASRQVPRGPYFHGTRRVYKPRDLLLTDVVNNQPGEEDDRPVCFATTSETDALRWAYQRGIEKGPILYVYEVEMTHPKVDVNMYPPGAPVDDDELVTSVMSHEGRVVCVVREVPVTDYPDAWFGHR
jgi:hypothetical protein